MGALIATRKDQAAITRIARRAARLVTDGDPTATVLAIEMDVTACHLNGCPLDLARLESAPDADLMHDVGGISRHLDRETGQLRRFFLPRCARPEREARRG